MPLYRDTSLHAKVASDLASLTLLKKIGFMPGGEAPFMNVSNICGEREELQACMVDRRGLGRRKTWSEASPASHASWQLSPFLNRLESLTLRPTLLG